MRKINWKVSITTLLLLLTGQCTAMSNDTTRFEWNATECAPHHYPMKIIQGTFIYHGEAEEGLYIPSGGALRAGWGNPISSHSTDEKFKRLPDRLRIIFFSYAEKQFYKGEFDLPYEKILALFRDGVAHPRVYPNGSTTPTYTRIMAGIAPGGAVAVWVTGIKTAEVFFGQAQKIELNPSSAFGLPFKDKQDSDAYIAKQLVNSLQPAELESLKKDGIPFGLWARYRNRYDWTPTLKEGFRAEDFDAFFLNGEYEKAMATVAKIESNSQRPVPTKVSFYSIVNGRQVLFEIEFEEFETMAAFEKLGAHGKKVFLEFEPRMPERNIKIRIYNDKESIELKKFFSQE